jgi:alpha-maltose-1-phosphate synthase
VHPFGIRDTGPFEEAAIIPARSIVCVAPVLPTDTRQYSLALAETNWLRALICGAAYHDDSLTGRSLTYIDTVLNRRIRLSTENRCIREAIPTGDVCFHPVTEILAGVLSKLGLKRSSELSNDAIFSRLDRAASRQVRKTDRLVIGREDCCLQTFRAGHRVGALALYDLPTAHHSAVRTIRKVEDQEFPSAERLEVDALTFRDDRLKRKDREIEAADYILAPSQFVKNSLVNATVDPEKVKVVPYGCETGRDFHPLRGSENTVLYVGRLSRAKGIPRLLRVWKKLGAYRTHTLRLIGKQFLQPSFLADYAGMYEHIPNMPRSELWKHYSAAQLFVFPSACDGFGLVLNEAMSCGTPIIASSNTGAPGFITEGVEGVTYEHGNDEALATHLEQMLSNPKRTAEMGRAAHEFAQVNGWVRYRASIREFVERLLGKSCV